MRVIRIVLVLAVLGGIGWFVWQQQHPTVHELPMSPVDKGSVESAVSNTRAGTVKACRRAKLSPSIGGQISALPFAKGSSVKTGQTLLRLWNKDLQANLLAAREAVTAAERRQEASCQEAAEAARAAQRADRLRQSANISEDDLDRAHTAATTAEANCKASEAQVSAAVAQRKAAAAQLERTVLKAPFSGVVADINGELNEYVTPSPPGIQTLPVIDLIEPGCFLVSAPIDEVDAPKLRAGLPARVTLDAWRGREFSATVSRVGDYVIDLEKQARTVEVELTFANKDDIKDLLAGYSADVDIILETRQDVLRVPTEALLENQYVYRLTLKESQQNGALPQGTLQKIRVETGLWNWTYTEVTSGLDEGDLVVTAPGSEGLADGVVARQKQPASDQETTSKNE